MTRPTLFDALAARDDLIGTRSATWCPRYAEQMAGWERLGGVPADLSTVEAFVTVGLALWRKHEALLATVEDLLGTKGVAS